MVGSIRLVRVTLTSLAIVAGFGLSLPPSGKADDKPAEQDKKPGSKQARLERAGKGDAGKAASTSPSQSRVDLSKFFDQPGDDPPRPFVPLRPATVDDRRRIEAVRLYSAARALEDRRQWTDAVALLQEALKLDPDSVAIARRLGRIYVGCPGSARPGPSIWETRAGRRAGRYRYPDAAGRLLQQERAGRGRGPFATRFWPIPSSMPTRRAGC